jgi:methionyl-tRNA formyltransferase
MLIQILIDNSDSWILPYANKLVEEIKEIFKYDVILLHKHDNVVSGDILFMLSCEKFFKRLDLNKKNIVVHESDLPEGKGWSPVTWQILEGKKKIPVTLFEAVKEIDAGEIYLQDYIFLQGGELLPEIKDLQGNITNKLVLNFLKLYPNIQGKPQQGNGSFYEKRTAKNSQLNIEKSIKDQFDLLRVCDNERYPSFFIINEQKYILKIYHGKE